MARRRGEAVRAASGGQPWPPARNSDVTLLQAPVALPRPAQHRRRPRLAPRRSHEGERIAKLSQFALRTPLQCAHPRSCRGQDQRDPAGHKTTRAAPLIDWSDERRSGKQLASPSMFKRVRDSLTHDAGSATRAIEAAERHHAQLRAAAGQGPSQPAGHGYARARSRRQAEAAREERRVTVHAAVGGRCGRALDFSPFRRATHSPLHVSPSSGFGVGRRWIITDDVGRR